MGGKLMGAPGSQLRESARAVADVFRNRNLRLINLALAGSVIGDWAWSVALGVYAYQRGGATALGVLGVVRYVSMSLLSPLISVIADRMDRKRVMIVSDLIRVGTTLAVGLIVFADGPALIVYVLAVVTSWVSCAFRPAQAALMPSLANNPGELTASNVSSKTIHSVGFFAGPAIAGLMLAFTTTGWVMVFDAATFLWSAVLAIGLKLPKTEVAAKAEAAEPEAATQDTEPAAKTGMFAGAGDGYRAIFRSKELRLMVGLYVAQTVVAGASGVFCVAIALDLLKMGEGGVGVLNAALGVGGIIGGVVALVLALRGKLARDFALGVGLWAAPLLLIAAWPRVVSALIAMALIGLGNSVVDVNAETIIQRLVPDEVLGRVFGALDSAVIGGMAIGALAMPILIHTMGLRSGLVVIGSVITAIVLVSLAGFVRIDKVALAPEGLELLRAVPMLGVLADNVLERLARFSAVVTVPAGRTVFAEGDSGDLFYVIESGSVDVTIGGAHRRTLNAGDSFGEIALLRDVPRTATIVVTSDLVARTIDRRHFLPAVTGHDRAHERAESVVANFLAAD
jgi:MFS family permease